MNRSPVVTQSYSDLWASCYAPRPRGHFGIARSVRLFVPWRSCLSHRHAGYLQLSYCRPPEMCAPRTRPRTDVYPPRFLDHMNCHRRGGAYRLVAPGAIPCLHTCLCLPSCPLSKTYCRLSACRWECTAGPTESTCKYSLDATVDSRTAQTFLHRPITGKLWIDMTYIQARKISTSWLKI